MKVYKSRSQQTLCSFHKMLTCCELFCDDNIVKVRGLLSCWNVNINVDTGYWLGWNSGLFRNYVINVSVEYWRWKFRGSLLNFFSMLSVLAKSSRKLDVFSWVTVLGLFSSKYMMTLLNVPQWYDNTTWCSNITTHSHHENGRYHIQIMDACDVITTSPLRLVLPWKGVNGISRKL